MQCQPSSIYDLTFIQTICFLNSTSWEYIRVLLYKNAYIYASLLHQVALNCRTLECNQPQRHFGRGLSVTATNLNIMSLKQHPNAWKILSINPALKKTYQNTTTLETVPNKCHQACFNGKGKEKTLKKSLKK